MRSNVQRAKLATISLYAVAASSLLFAFSYLINVYVISVILKGEYMSSNAINVFQMYSSLTVILYAITYCICAVFFILWLTRAYRNIQLRFPNSKFSYKPWLAAVVWFVPIWNLFGPYVITSNLFDKTERYLVSEDKMLPNRHYDIVKGVWWSLWIASAILIRISQNYASSHVFSNFANITSFFGFVLSIICALLAVKMIKNYSEMERLLESIDQHERVGVPSMSNNDLLDSGI